MSEIAHLMNGFEYPELINHTSIPGVVRFRIDRETPTGRRFMIPESTFWHRGKR